MSEFSPLRFVTEIDGKIYLNIQESDGELKRYEITPRQALFVASDLLDKVLKIEARG